MSNEAFKINMADLAELDKERIPDHFVPACHLIYSSPATLSYNSPGALGFGVKRAGLVIPESVMLLVSPDCCARNSTVLSANEGYADRMFYLMMSQTDLVTGRHLKKIPEAVKEIVDCCETKPKVVVICITCVDALLGTDLERIARKAEEELDGVKVVPSYMYALEREGRKPPMTAIRQTIYSLIEKKEIRSDMINIMGFFTGLDPDTELLRYLEEAGVTKINEVANCGSLDEYYEMGAANFNLLLHPESRFAAEDLRKRLGMPYIELTRLYDPEKIHKQYMLFASGIGVSFDDIKEYEMAKAAKEKFERNYAGTSFAIGEMANTNPYELALSLCNMGMKVKRIFANVTEDDFAFIPRLAKISPETEVLTGISPSMINYAFDEEVDVTIGKDAESYMPNAINVPWNSEVQPFGFKAFTDLIAEIEQALSRKGRA